MTKRILVVEDQPDSRRIIRDMLASTDYEIIEAENGEEALAAVGKQRPDHHPDGCPLPIIDGYTATRRIKADPTLRSIPIIAVTSYALDGQEKIARAAGCDDYVPKPYSPRELLAKIRQHLFKPPITCCSVECPLWGVKRTSARHCAIASDCSASSRLSILYFFSVKWLRRAARTEVARDYRRFCGEPPCSGRVAGLAAPASAPFPFLAGAAL